MKELIWVLQFVPLKDIIMTSLIVHLLGSHWDDKLELRWGLQIELQMDLNLGLMKELIWVLQLAPMKHKIMVSLMGQ